MVLPCPGLRAASFPVDLLPTTRENKTNINREKNHLYMNYFGFCIKRAYSTESKCETEIE